MKMELVLGNLLEAGYSADATYVGTSQETAGRKRVPA